MPAAVLKHREITERVLKAFYNVYNEPGYGFLENVYENAMAIEDSSEKRSLKIILDAFSRSILPRKSRGRSFFQRSQSKQLVEAPVTVSSE